MIKNIEKVNDDLIWYIEDCMHSITIKDGSFISNDNNIIIMNEARDQVVVLDESGKQIDVLNNSDKVYLMYLQKHPRFGITVVASLQDENGNWSDKYLSWTSKRFEVVSNSR